MAFHLPPLVCLVRHRLRCCLYPAALSACICLVFLKQVFGKADRLGTTASAYTVEGYYERNDTLLGLGHAEKLLHRAQDMCLKNKSSWWASMIKASRALMVSVPDVGMMHQCGALRCSCRVRNLRRLMSRYSAHVACTGSALQGVTLLPPSSFAAHRTP
jgi:hypothetical protein